MVKHFSLLGDAENTCYAPCCNDQVMIEKIACGCVDFIERRIIFYKVINFLKYNFLCFALLVIFRKYAYSFSTTNT
jgi:hypothetical protein